MDRISRYVIRKSIGGYRELANVSAREKVGEIDRQLRQLRQLRSQLEQGLTDGAIRRTGGYLDIPDSALAGFLDTLRQRCVDDMNKVLVAAGLPAI